MEKSKRLFHGSDKFIEENIEPQKAHDETSSYNSQLGIYATDRFEVAAGMSLVGDRWAFANYDDIDFKVIFAEHPPEPSIPRYVYELSSETFYQDSESKHQWFSPTEAKILKVHTFTTEDLSNLWRMATKTEVVAHTPKDN